MESYFLIYLVDGVKQYRNEYNAIAYKGDSSIKWDNIFLAIKSKFDLIEQEKNAFLLNCMIILTPNIQNDFLLNISAEVCLFHFEDGIKILYDLGTYLYNNYMIHIFHPICGKIEPNSYEDLLKIFKDIYRQKIDEFDKKYGRKNDGIFVLPNNDFYEYISKGKGK